MLDNLSQNQIDDINSSTKKNLSEHPEYLKLFQNIIQHFNNDYENSFKILSNDSNLIDLARLEHYLLEKQLNLDKNNNPLNIEQFLQYLLNQSENGLSIQKWIQLLGYSLDQLNSQSLYLKYQQQNEINMQQTRKNSGKIPKVIDSLSQQDKSGCLDLQQLKQSIEKFQKTHSNKKNRRIFNDEYFDCINNIQDFQEFKKQQKKNKVQNNGSYADYNENNQIFKSIQQLQNFFNQKLNFNSSRQKECQEIRLEPVKLQNMIITPQKKQDFLENSFEKQDFIVQNQSCFSISNEFNSEINSHLKDEDQKNDKHKSSFQKCLIDQNEQQDQFFTGLSKQEQMFDEQVLSEAMIQKGKSPICSKNPNFIDSLFNRMNLNGEKSEQFQEDSRKRRNKDFKMKSLESLDLKINVIPDSYLFLKPSNFEFNQEQKLLKADQIKEFSLEKYKSSGKVDQEFHQIQTKSTSINFGQEFTSSQTLNFNKAQKADEKFNILQNFQGRKDSSMQFLEKVKNNPIFQKPGKLVQEQNQLKSFLNAQLRVKDINIKSSVAPQVAKQGQIDIIKKIERKDQQQNKILGYDWIPDMKKKSINSKNKNTDQNQNINAGLDQKNEQMVQTILGKNQQNSSSYNYFFSYLSKGNKNNNETSYNWQKSYMPQYQICPNKSNNRKSFQRDIFDIKFQLEKRRKQQTLNENRIAMDLKSLQQFQKQSLNFDNMQKKYVRNFQEKLQKMCSLNNFTQQKTLQIYQSQR